MPTRSGAAILAVTTVFLLASVACIGLRRDRVFLIFATYHGWAVIEYDVPGAPKIPIKDGNLIYRLGPGGILRTSSLPVRGYGRDEFFYYDHQGRMDELQGGIMADQPDDMIHHWISLSGNRPKDVFFVGPRSTVEQYDMPEPEID